ncbi:hypothetical protein [Haladaptatus caseinilyticus]|uniref:hypothetical protein n=1 Tax=Haladaptatus caseinilyticus TaxID=2993314 RepID=UPI00224B1002|nr:hypothetical protein [Haladaptatus caseinilyticus]
MLNWYTRIKQLLAVVFAVGLIYSSIGTTVAANAMVDDFCAGTHNLGVLVNGDDGDPVADKQVTVINKKTGDKVFTGTTDNAGQIDVTLPRGQYEVIAGSQSKLVNLNKDQDITFTLPTDELPKAQ